ncbi:MAG: hypothetical protein PHU05_02710 [Bacilli bacterium]|nr:hypothetical protein [Bacilli bacterium]
MEKEFEKEMNNIEIMKGKGMLTYDMLVIMLTKISKKYNLPIILKEKNRTTNQTTIRTIA